MLLAPHLKMRHWMIHVSNISTGLGCHSKGGIRNCLFTMSHLFAIDLSDTILINSSFRMLICDLQLQRR